MRIKLARYGLLLAPVLLVAACSSSPSTITSHGNFIVQEDCGSASTDYPDVSAGVQVVATNSAGAVIGTGDLKVDQDLMLTTAAADSLCAYSFTVTVPASLPRYGITVSHRGTIWFSAKQMTAGPVLTLSAASS